MSLARLVTLSVLVSSISASAASAQTLGTFRWRTEPFCNVLNLTVTQNGSTFTLDGFDEQCGGNPRLPVHGIAVPQPDGTITLGLSVVHDPGDSAPVNLEAVISPSTVSGTWRDSAGFNGSFEFNPTAASGWPRPGATVPAQIPTSFIFSPNGAFAATARTQPDPLPVSGPGKRLVWHAAKGAFRAGQVDGDQWNDNNIGFYSAAFGIRTRAAGTGSFAAGVEAIASGSGSTAIGDGTTAEGVASTAMGVGTKAIGDYSTAMGYRAIAAGNGSFVYGDWSIPSEVSSTLPNQFIVRAAGGVVFWSSKNTTNGPNVALFSGASAWSSLSDAHAKENFRDLSDDDLLARIARLPIREWNFKAQDASIRHVGPTAQDFHAAFGLGEDPLRISTVDADGIALRAVQALEARTRQTDQRNRVLEAELLSLRDRLAQLELLLVEKR